MPRPDETWLTRRAAAEYLTRIGCPVTKRTLERKAANGNLGRGPPYTRTGWRIVRYLQADLDDWAEKRKVRIE
jgi:hypothetical protein